MQHIHYRTKEQIKKIEKAGMLAARCHQLIKKKIRAGITTKQVDLWVDQYIRAQGATPAQLGYKGYQYASCISVNEVACHGIPNEYKLQAGDIVTVDFVVDVDGWKADCARTYGIGTISAEATRLIKVARLALQAGIKAARIGADLVDIGYAIERVVDKAGYQIVKAFVGHGIGEHIHEAPQVGHIRAAKSGISLQEGMVITIEPIVSIGEDELFIERDGWTATTVDHSITAQFEHTIAITRKGPRILTSLSNLK